MKTEADKRGRNLELIRAALEYFASIMISGAFLANITGGLGLSDSLTGILSSIVSISCLFQIAMVRVVNRFSRIKKLVITMSLVNELLFAFAYLTPTLPIANTAKTVLFVIALILAYFLYNTVCSQKLTWLVSMVEEGNLGSYTAVKEIISLLSGMAFTFVMGRVIDIFKEKGQMREAFIVGCLTIVAISILQLLTTLGMPDKQITSPKTSIDIRGMLRDKGLVRLILVSVFWSMTQYSAVPFYGAYQVNELGFSMTFVSALSIVYGIARSVVSPFFGRYADKTSFSRSFSVGLIFAGTSFLVNCFTTPANGKIFYTLYYVLFAISMASINNSLTNMVFTYVKGEGKSSAMAFSQSASGVVGFLTTCAVSPLVQKIQSEGNMFLGMQLHAAQVVSAIAFILSVLLWLYLHFIVIRKENTGNELIHS